MREFTAEPEDVGLRLDIYVTSKYPKFTRSSLEALFDRGLVEVDGTKEKASYRLKPKDKVSVDEALLKSEPAKIDLPVIYEDEDVIVIDKPAGVLTHSKGALNLEPTVASFIKPKIKDRLLEGNRAGIVHRLDRDTSGVIIAAKDSKALRQLQKQFSNRKVKKAYLAIVEGNLSPADALIDVPVARNPKKPQTFYVNSSGKTAQTEYKTLQSFHKKGRPYSLLELKPLTGRTHQLRVHLAYVKHPVVGDRLYGQPADHMLLHASSLEITLPGGERKTFKAQTPGYITKFTGYND